MQHIITASHSDIEAEALIYPRYETRGDLKKSVEFFCNWLEKKIEEREKKMIDEEKLGNIWVCLIGHSMGGLLGNMCTYVHYFYISYS